MRHNLSGLLYQKTEVTFLDKAFVCAWLIVTSKFNCMVRDFFLSVALPHHRLQCYSKLETKAYPKIGNANFKSALSTFKVRSDGAAAAAIFLPQQPESVHTVQLQFSYIFK